LAQYDTDVYTGITLHMLLFNDVVVML